MKKKQININRLLPVFSILLVLILWELFVVISDVPTYVLPKFTEVLTALFTNRSLLILHARYTLSEALIGITISIFIGVITAFIMDQSSLIKKLLYPIIAISQTIPLMAIAPLFIIWFGFGMLPKVLVVILVCFFPITINIMTGFEEIDQDKLDLFNVMKATKKDVYFKLKIPSALPYFFSGLKIATTYAILAALIGEFMGGKYGLGLYLESARRSFAIENVFAIIMVVIATTLLLLGALQLLEKRIITYKGDL